MARKRRKRASRSQAAQSAMLVWSMWRWLPPSQKRRVLLLARRHGMWLLSRELKRRRAR
ncbi:MAG TPA: hypothetical protein VLV28_11285 [Gaiellaceae bacterium]|nr:hypothetical protein [Gaiellaceae bacterium]